MYIYYIYICSWYIWLLMAVNYPHSDFGPLGNSCPAVHPCRKHKNDRNLHHKITVLCPTKRANAISLLCIKNFMPSELHGTIRSKSRWLSSICNFIATKIVIANMDVWHLWRTKFYITKRLQLLPLWFLTWHRWFSEELSLKYVIR